jgi:hypothetical protein
LFEVINTAQMQIPQEPKFDGRFQMSELKHSANRRNGDQKVLQLTQEEKWIEEMNNMQMQIPQEPKLSNQFRISHAKAPSNI